MNVKRPGAGGFRLAGFPKEFERNLFESFDKRYYSIFLLSFLLFYGFGFYVASQDWQLSEDQITALKERVIQKVYTDIIMPEEPEPEPEDEQGSGEAPVEEEEETDVSDKGRERVEESQTQKVERRKRTQASAEERSRKMQQEVANQGILAIATSAGGAGAGNVAYNDVLQNLEGGGVGDIGAVVEGTSGISVAGDPGDRTRAAKGSGQRNDGTGVNIDGMISGETVSGSSNFSRRGKINLKSENVRLTQGAGSRDSETITAAINKQSATIEYCYKQRAKVNPNLKGRIDLEITIAPRGRVNQATILNSSLGDKRLESCIVRNIKRWRFGAVDDGGPVKIRVPFIF
ncbi:MAG: TonB family protein [Calditrichia bacterium]